jgi:hypothetical protein
MEERWEWAGQAVGQLLAAGYAREQPLLAADPGGCLPYFSRLAALDMLGLNDRYLATHPPPGFGAGYVGHELGDGAYVLRRQPDLVVLCRPWGSDHGCFPSGRQLLALPEFRARYVLRHFEATTPFVQPSRIWIRRDGRAGVRREGDRLVIPAPLLAVDGLPARLGDPGFRLAVPAGRTVWLEDLDLPPGRWRVVVRGRGRFAPSFPPPAAPPGEPPGLVGPATGTFSLRALTDGVIEQVWLLPRGD